MAAETVKMCDMNMRIAATVFEMLNEGKVKIKTPKYPEMSVYRIEIVTDVEPKDLTYPEGWYYAKGCFRNKHQSTTGRYSEARMVKSDGESWRNIAHYCTLYLD